MPDPEKRPLECVPILGELQGEIMVFQPMLIRDISKGGVTVRPASAAPRLVTRAAAQADE
jgi:hypothetical protein